MAKGSRWDMKRKLANMRKLERTLPKRIANKMEQFIMENFDRESFSDGSVGSDPWKKRKYATKQDKRTGKKRNLLVQSGSLRGSIKVGSATMKKIAVGSYGVKYAKYHNRGTGRLPQRQFVGESKLLTRRIQRMIQKEMKNII